MCLTKRQAYKAEHVGVLKYVHGWLVFLGCVCASDARFNIEAQL